MPDYGVGTVAIPDDECTYRQEIENDQENN
jgi:hypothetical protein